MDVFVNRVCSLEIHHVSIRRAIFASEVDEDMFLAGQFLRLPETCRCFSWDEHSGCSSGIRLDLGG